MGITVLVASQVCHSVHSCDSCCCCVIVLFALGCHDLLKMSIEHLL